MPCKTSSDPARGWRVLKRRVCAIAWLAKRSLSELHHSPTSQVSDARCQMRKRYSKKQHGGRQSRGLLITTKALADLGETSWFQERSQSALSKPRRWSCPKQPALALVEVHTCRCWQTAPCDSAAGACERRAWLSLPLFFLIQCGEGSPGSGQSKRSGQSTAEKRREGHRETLDQRREVFGSKPGSPVACWLCLGLSWFSQNFPAFGRFVLN